MLPIPRGGSSVINLVGIDPGSESLGICVMSVDVITEKILSTNAYTVFGSRLGGSEWLGDLHGDRFKRIAGLRENLILVFNEHRPFSIAVEAPFFNSLRPQAYGVLMEVMAGIRAAVAAYDLWQAPYLIDPSSVKNAVGASGNAKKEIIRAAIIKLQDINPVIDLKLLDEHSLDAIAVCYCRFKRLFKG